MHALQKVGGNSHRSAMGADERKYALRVSAAPEKSHSQARKIRDRSAFVLIIGATFGVQSLTLVTGIIMARMLGAEGRGIIALVFALGLFTSQLTFGASLPNAIAKNLAERRVTARDGLHDIARRRFAWLLPPCLCAAGFMLYLQRSASHREAILLGGAVFLMALQTVTFRILAGGLQGESRLVTMAWASVVPQLLFAVVLSVAWAAGWDWSALQTLAAYYVTSAIGLAVSFAALMRPTHRVADRLDERELWRESRRSYVGSVRPLDGLGLDRIIVGSVVGTSSLGLYSAALAVSNLCSLVSNAVVVIVLPRVAMHYDDPPAQRRVIRRWLGVSGLLIVAIVGVLELTVSVIIPAAFGDEFAGAVDCARWLILADGFMAFRKVLIAALQGQGRGGSASLIELAMLPFMLIGVLVAAWHDSLVGIGVSLVIVALASCAALLSSLGAKTGAHSSRVPVRYR
jgi:O-antigen/teichoic acid export membrane protein